MNKTKLIFSILAILLGGFLFVFGGYDDSPGAQLLGVIVVLAGAYGIYKARKKNTPTQPQ